MIAFFEVLWLNRLQTAQALCHVLAGHFKVHAAGHSALGFVDFKEALNLAHHVLEVAGLIALNRFRVAVHRIARPNNIASLGLDLTYQRWQQLAHLGRRDPRDQHDTSGVVAGVQDVQQLDQVVGIH